MYSVFVLALLSLSCLSASGTKIKYDDYQVFNIYAKNLNEVTLLHSITTNINEERAFLLLGDMPAIGKSYSVAVSPAKLESFVQELKAKKIAYRVIEKNLQKIVDVEEAANQIQRRRGKATSSFGWTHYQTLTEVNAWLKKKVKEHKKLKALVGGKSYEGRKIRGVKLSHKRGNPAIFIEAGIHAREWITVAATTFMLNELLTSKNKTIQQLARNYDWYFFPTVNPDGYEYTHTTDRMWRKTRKPYGRCHGADPNRNWGFHWNEVGSSDDPCDETYAGPSAFSEVETKSLSKYVSSIKKDIKAYLAFHSFSQLILFPYGYTAKHAPNHDDLQQIGDKAKEALAKRYGTKYTVGNVHDVIYPASGASMGWAYGKLGVKLAYTYELRPSGGNIGGFILPPGQIIPTSLETLDSLVALVKEGEKLGYFK